MFLKKPLWIGALGIPMVIAGLFALHLNGQYRYAHAPLRSVVVARPYLRVGQSVQGLSFSPDGKTLAVADAQMGLSLWTSPELKCINRFDHFVGDRVSSLHWVTTKEIVMGDLNGVSRWSVHDVWLTEMKTQASLPVRVVPKNSFEGFYKYFVVSHRGKFAAGANEHGDLVTWDLNSGRKLFAIDGPPLGRFGFPLEFCDIAFSPDDKVIFTSFLNADESLSSALTEVVVRDFETGKIVHHWQNREAFLLNTRDVLGNTGLALSDDGSLLAIASMAKVAVLDSHMGAVKHTLTPPLGPNKGGYGGGKRLVFFSGGRFLAGVGWGNVIPIWNVETGKLVQTFYGQNYLESLAVSPDGHWLATGGQDIKGNGRIELWDVSRLNR